MKNSVYSKTDVKLFVTTLLIRKNCNLYLNLCSNAMELQAKEHIIWNLYETYDFKKNMKKSIMFLVVP